MATAAEDAIRQGYIKWAFDAFERLKDDYKKYDEYYNGDHPVTFHTDRWKSSFGTTFESFSDNWCQVVVDTAAQRLEIIGWTSEDDKPAARIAEQIWDDEFVGDEEEELHLQTFIKGDGHIMVWPDPQDETNPSVYFNDALDVTVHYDPKDRKRILRACKKWRDDQGQRHLYIYFPDRIEHYLIPNDTPYAATAGVWTPDEDMPLPQGWEKQGDEANPYGIVPVFHFKNRGSASTHGVSELKTVVPIQNAVNKMLMDLMIGSEFGSFRQKWMAGGGHPAEGWKAGAERVWATTDPNAKFGEFDQIDLEPFVKSVEMLVAHIAKTTQTPMHYLRSSGDMPSGEALKTAESGLVSKIKNRQKRWGHQWSKAMTFAVRLRMGDWPKSPVIPVWKSAETRHELEQAQTQQLKSILGVPLEKLWSEMGYTEEEITQFKEDNKSVAAAALAQLLSQEGQVAPGTNATLGELLGLDETANLAGMDIPQILAQLGKGKTAQTTAGEATVKPQANTRPPASPTRRSRGFRN